MQIQPVRVILLSAAIYALYLPFAVYLQHSYVPPKAPPGTLAVLADIVHQADNGLAYYGKIPLDQFKRPVTLYENETPLGPPVPIVDDVMNFGKGRYFKWKDEGFAFSSSDNSDPRTNGRHYWIVAR